MVLLGMLDCAVFRELGFLAAVAASMTGAPQNQQLLRLCALVLNVSVQPESMGLFLVRECRIQ